MKKKKASFHAYLILLTSQGMLNYLNDRTMKVHNFFAKTP